MTTTKPNNQIKVKSGLIFLAVVGFAFSGFTALFNDASFLSLNSKRTNSYVKTARDKKAEQDELLGVIQRKNLRVIAIKSLLDPTFKNNKMMAFLFQTSLKLQKYEKDFTSPKGTKSELIKRKLQLEKEIKQLTIIAHSLTPL